MLKNKTVLLLVILMITVLGCTSTTTIGSNLFPTPVVVSTPNALTLPQPTASLQSSPAPQPVVQNNNQDVLVSLYDRVSPGVVLILALTSDGGGQGSGFVYNKDGYIITNEHVVSQATQIFVNFSNGNKVHGKVVADDLDSDIAVIKVDVSADQLVPLPLGDSEKVKVGQTVVAIGNPYGLAGTITEGIVSAKGRIVDSLHQTSQGQSFSSGDGIQTDASINPGNSGGPLLDLNGDVIGINRQIISGGTMANGDLVNTGIGFAIPINIVKKVLPTLIKDGHYDYPYLGLTAQEELSLPAIELLKLTQTTGAYVVDVTPGGPAAKAGIIAGSKKTSIDALPAGGDLIIAADGHPVRVFGDLLSYLLAEKSPGDTIKLTVIRDGKQVDVEVTLDKRPK